MNDVATRPQWEPGPVSPIDTSISSIIVRAASDPNVDIDKLERLLAAQERMQAKQAQVEFDAAMSNAQEGMNAVRTDSHNPSTRSKFASYAALDFAVRPTYVAHGFSLSFYTGDTALADHVRIICRVAHRSGHRETPHIDMPCDGKGAKGGDVMTKTHAMGSAVTYGKRYLLGMIFNIAVGSVDDDGNAAAGKGMAGGGTQFRDERKPANGVPSNFVEAARQDGTLDATRTKGEMPGKPKSTPAQERATKWTTSAIEQWALVRPSVEWLTEFWKANDFEGKDADGKFAAITMLRERYPDEYERLAIAFENAKAEAANRQGAA